jgi:hypothetical protein
VAETRSGAPAVDITALQRRNALAATVRFAGPHDGGPAAHRSVALTAEPVRDGSSPGDHRDDRFHRAVDEVLKRIQQGRRERS